VERAAAGQRHGPMPSSGQASAGRMATPSCLPPARDHAVVVLRNTILGTKPGRRRPAWPARRAPAVSAWYRSVSLGGLGEVQLGAGRHRCSRRHGPRERFGEQFGAARARPASPGVGGRSRTPTAASRSPASTRPAPPPARPRQPAPRRWGGRRPRRPARWARSGVRGGEAGQPQAARLTAHHGPAPRAPGCSARRVPRPLRSAAGLATAVGRTLRADRSNSVAPTDRSAGSSVGRPPMRCSPAPWRPRTIRSAHSSRNVRR